MVKDLFKLSCIGWNVFLHGSFKKRLIAHMAIGAIVGGTRAGIESATGIREKRREEEARRRREMDLKLYKLNVDISNDLRKAVEKSIETDLQMKSIDELQHEIEEMLNAHND